MTTKCSTYLNWITWCWRCYICWCTSANNWTATNWATSSAGCSILWYRQHIVFRICVFFYSAFSQKFQLRCSAFNSILLCVFVRAFEWIKNSFRIKNQSKQNWIICLRAELHLVKFKQSTLKNMTCTYKHSMIPLSLYL